jgi:hypothetical protein
LAQFAEQVQDGFAGMRVEVASGFVRKDDILRHTELGQQVKELEYETDLLIADGRQLRGRSLFDQGVVQPDGAARGRVQTAQNVIQFDGQHAK